MWRSTALFIVLYLPCQSNLPIYIPEKYTIHYFTFNQYTSLLITKTHLFAPFNL